jgi:hypothetical protein
MIKSKNQNGGYFFGSGSFGKVVGKPRAPFLEKYSMNIIKKNELRETRTFNQKEFNLGNLEDKEKQKNIKDIKKLKEVSKFFENVDDFYYEVNDYVYVLNNIFKGNNNKQTLNKYFNIPLNQGIINTNLMYKNNRIYNLDWFNTKQYLLNESSNNSNNESIPNSNHTSTLNNIPLKIHQNPFNALANNNSNSNNSNNNSNNSKVEVPQRINIENSSNNNSILSYNQINEEFSDQILNYCNYQITFSEGISVKNMTIKIFLKKYINILEGIKLLIRKKLLFDDFKLDNIIFVNNEIKFSDFSTILEFDKIKLTKIKNLNDILPFHKPFYFTYNPFLSTILEYYMLILNNRLFNKHKLYSDIYKERDTRQNSYVQQILNTILDVLNKDITINFEKVYKIEKGKITKTSIELSLEDLFDKIYLCRSSRLSENDRLFILDSIVLFYDKKYRKSNKNSSNLFISANKNNNDNNKNNKNNINNSINTDYYIDVNNLINDILKRINIYSTGFIILSFLFDKFLKSGSIPNNQVIIDIIYNLIEISMKCCMNFYWTKDSNTNEIVLYIFEPKINNIIDKYNLIVVNNN